MVKRFLGMIFSIILASLAISLLMKAAIGVAPNDAFTQTVANVTKVKIGNISMIINISFIIIQIIFLREKFEKTQYFQFVSAFFVGTVINVFYYNFLNFELTTYFSRLIVFLIGLATLSFTVASVMVIDFALGPLEGFLKMIADKTNGNFVKYRWYYDVVAVVMCLILSLIFKVDILIREGTLISLLLFSPLVGYFMKLLKPSYERLKLTPEN